MLKSCVMICTVVESSPSSAMAAKISHSLPKPHEPIFLPSKSATESMPESAHDTWRVPELLEDLGDLGEVRALLDRPEHLRHPRDGVVHVAVGERVLRHDVAARGDDLDLQALLLEVAELLRGEVAGELALREPLELELHRRELAVGALGLARSAAGCRTCGEGERGREGEPADRRDATSAVVHVSPFGASHVFFSVRAVVRCSARACTRVAWVQGRRRAWRGVALQQSFECERGEEEEQPEGDRREDVRPRAGVGARGRRRRDEPAEPAAGAAEVLGDEGRDHRERRGDADAGEDERSGGRERERAQHLAGARGVRLHEVAVHGHGLPEPAQGVDEHGHERGERRDRLAAELAVGAEHRVEHGARATIGITASEATTGALIWSIARHRAASAARSMPRIEPTMRPIRAFVPVMSIADAIEGQ